MNIKHFFYLQKNKKIKTFSTTTRCCLVTRIKKFMWMTLTNGRPCSKIKKRRKEKKREEHGTKYPIYYCLPKYNQSTIVAGIFRDLLVLSTQVGRTQVFHGT